MLLALLSLPFLCFGLSTVPCPTYTCSTAVNSTLGSSCISNSSYAYSLSLCSNSSYYCEISGPGQGGLCELSYSLPVISYPGEACTANSTCTSGNCNAGMCTGNARGGQCVTNVDCAVGLSCRNQNCTALILSGSSGCNNDYDCINSAGCSFINNDEEGDCVDYYSLAEYTEVESCHGNRNKLCYSGLCAAYQGGYVCLPEVQNSGNSPYMCSTADYCYSQNDTYTGTILKGKCECSIGGNSYCSLFPGDPETYDYKNYRNAWINSQQINSCHTERRFEEQCMSQMWDSKKYSYLYYEDYVNLYGKIYNYTDCALQMYFPVAYYHYSSLQLSEAAFLAVLAMFLVI